MREKTLKTAGFSLIELMIVVAIIAILAALAIPDFLRYVTKTRQSEAKMNLGEIYVAQMAYYGEHSTFAGGGEAFNKIGWEALTRSAAKYCYLMDSALWAAARGCPSSMPSPLSSTARSFTVIAAGNIDNDAFIDVWGINNSKVLKNRVPTASGWGASGDDVNN